jgi:hypothetical protein
MAGNVIFFLLGALTLTLMIVLYRVIKVIYGELTSPWRHLPGPPNSNLLFGNFEDILKDVCPFMVWRFTSDLSDRNQCFVGGGLNSMGGRSDLKDFSAYTSLR